MIGRCLGEIEMYVCICKAVTDQDLEDLMSAGCTNIRDLQKKCKVGADCGACLNSVREMVQSRENAAPAGGQHAESKD